MKSLNTKSFEYFLIVFAKKYYKNHSLLITLWFPTRDKAFTFKEKNFVIPRGNISQKFNKGWILADEMIFIAVSKQRTLPPWTQVVNWMHIRSLEDVLDVFSTSYMRSIYALCSGGSCVHSSYFSFLYDLIFGCKHDSINFTIESIRSFFNWFIDSTAELNIFSPRSSMLASSSIFTFSSCCKVKKY